METNKPHQADVSGPVLELATQMLRVLARAALQDKSSVQTEADRRKVIAEFWYTLDSTEISGEVFSTSLLPPEEYLAGDAATYQQAEALALSMFEDIFFGGGCGVEYCCGPAGVWHRTPAMNRAQHHPPH